MLPYQFEPKSWIKIINIRYTILMSNFVRNYDALTELSLVSTESKEVFI